MIDFLWELTGSNADDTVCTQTRRSLSGPPSICLTSRGFEHLNILQKITHLTQIKKPTISD